jgi:hypothetical protein
VTAHTRDAVETNQTGRRILSEVADALEGLLRRLATQQQAAAAIGHLATVAEEIAGSAKLLGYGLGAGGGEALLGARLEDFAAALGRTIEAAAEDALAGKQVAHALLEHAATVEALAAEVDTIDVAEILTRLRPLSATIEAVPQTQRASAARRAELDKLSERARALAVQAVEIAKSRPGSRREMVMELARSVAGLAKDIAQAATAFGEDAEAASKAARELLETARQGARGGPRNPAERPRAGPVVQKSGLLGVLNRGEAPKRREMEWKRTWS